MVFPVHQFIKGRPATPALVCCKIVNRAEPPATAAAIVTHSGRFDGVKFTPAAARTTHTLERGFL